MNSLKFNLVDLPPTSVAKKLSGNLENDLEFVCRDTSNLVFNTGTMKYTKHLIDSILHRYKQNAFGNYKQKVLRVHELRVSRTPHKPIPRESEGIRVIYKSTFDRYIRRFIPVTSFNCSIDLEGETVSYRHLIFDESKDEAIWNRRIEAKNRGEVLEPLFKITVGGSESIPNSCSLSGNTAPTIDWENNEY